MISGMISNGLGSISDPLPVRQLSPADILEERACLRRLAESLRFERGEALERASTAELLLSEERWQKAAPPPPESVARAVARCEKCDLVAALRGQLALAEERKRPERRRPAEVQVGWDPEGD